MRKFLVLDDEGRLVSPDYDRTLVDTEDEVLERIQKQASFDGCGLTDIGETWYKVYVITEVLQYTPPTDKGTLVSIEK